MGWVGAGWRSAGLARGCDFGQRWRMGLAADIRDRESLRAWLKGRPQAQCVWIAYRAAMRVAPIVWADPFTDKRKGDLTTLPVLRCTLISGVASTCPTPEIMPAAAAAATAAAATTATYAAAADAAATAAAAAAYAAATLWRDIASDCQAIEETEEEDGIPRRMGLWSGENPLERLWTQARAKWSSQGEGWQFWIDWYEDALAGREPDWKLLEKVALIGNAVWEAGAEAVNARIGELLLARQLDAIIKDNPYAWSVEIDPRSKKFRAIPVERRDLSEITKSVRENIKDFQRRCRLLRVGNFGQSVQLAFEPVITILRRDLKRYATSPLSLHKAIEAAKSEMLTIAEMEQYANESYLVRFFGALASDAEDICVAAPEVLAQLKAKNAVRYELYSLEQRRAMMMQSFGLYLDGEGMLKRAALQALRIIQDENSSDAQKKDAFHFVTAILPRAARAFVGHQIEHDGDAPKPSRVSVAKRAIEAADALWKLDKGVDALQENIPEFLEWVQPFIDSVVNSGVPGS